MAIPDIGIDTRMSFGEEGTWGTEVARTSPVLRCISSTLARHAEFTPLPHLVGAAAGQRVKGESYQARERTNGDVSTFAAYEGNAFGILLKHAMGAVADSGVGPYTHTYTLAQALPTGLSSVQQRGTSSVAEEFLGLKVSSLSLEVEAGGVMMLSVSFVGKTGNTRAAASPAIAALSTVYPIVHAHGGTLAFNAATHVLRKMTLKIDNKLDVDLHEFGSVQISEPAIADFADITLECEVFSRDNLLYVAHLAKTAGDVVIAFTDSTRSLTITGHNAIVEQYDDGISGPGPIVQKVRFRPYSDSSDGGLAIALVNAITTGILS